MFEPQAAVPLRRASRVPSIEEVLLVIDRILRDEVGVGFHVEPSTRIQSELALDSLGTFSLVVGLEDHFRVNLPEEFAEGIQSVGDLAALVVRQAEAEVAEGV